MGSLGRRLERLEASEARKGRATKSPVYLDVYFKELENIKREADGLSTIPFTEEEEAHRRESNRWFREEYLPSQREKDLGEHARAVLDRLEAHTKRTL